MQWVATCVPAPYKTQTVSSAGKILASVLWTRYPFEIIQTNQSFDLKIDYII